MKIDKASDRRRYFRINDSIGVDYERLDCDGNGEHEHVDMVEDISITRILEQQNVETVAAIDQVDKKYPEVAQALLKINKKIDTLLTLFEIESLADFNRYQHFEQANISACGMAFPINESLAPKLKIRLHLYLAPMAYEFSVIARVVACEAFDDDLFYLRAEFLEIKEADRERLIQHIVQRQSNLLKSLRETSD